MSTVTPNGGCGVHLLRVVGDWTTAPHNSARGLLEHDLGKYFLILAVY